MNDLTKWPRLLVTGEPVTRQQANEILVRTDDWWMSINDRDWQRQVAAIAAEYGRPTEPDWHTPGGHQPGKVREYHDARQAWNESMGILDLNYLHNERIASSWIGGPHGWCDWDGTIGCANYNIGKWPTVEEVTEDWDAIAAAFPYLTLRAQLVPDEGEAGRPAVEWRIAGGYVETVGKPDGLLSAPGELDDATILSVVFVGSGRERGVSPDRLREALSRVAGRR